MKTALITGVCGQDGCYLAEQLLADGYRVLGTARDMRASAQGLPPPLRERVELVQWDLRDQGAIEELLSRHQPAELYNLAAYSSGSGMYDDPVGIGEINGLAVARILEAMRVAAPQTRMCQASSREIFGAATHSPQSEATPVDPRSPYGAAKLYADAMIRVYRRHHDLYACSAILFNHESPRRRLEFVTRKIAHEAARIKLGLSNSLALGNLDAMRDWGYAGDYMRAMRLMLRQPSADDYVLATGEVHSVREFCDCAFGHLGLDYRDYVRGDGAAFRSAEPALLVGDSAKARARLGWQPQVGFRELVAMMVDADMRALSAANETR